MSISLPQQLYTAEQVRALDRFAIDDLGIDGFSLMYSAASAAFELLLASFPQVLRGSSLQVFCGAGNNGGDGYVLAMLAANRGIAVSVQALKEPEQLQGDALRAYQRCKEAGVEIQYYSNNFTVSADIVVDAMLGTGLSGEVRGAYLDAINAINGANKPVLAIDIPSGLCADTGAVLGSAVKAHITATFIGVKRGLLTGIGPELCGELHYFDLNLPPTVLEHLDAETHLICGEALLECLGPRPRHAHKGLSGHLLVVGGDYGMAGAAVMAAEAGLYSGAGLVSLATRPEHVAAAVARRPELMSKGISHSGEFKKLLEGKSAIVFGPGAGRSDWALELLQLAWTTETPLLLDADGLHLLNQLQLPARDVSWVMTPHPGEAAKLLGTDTSEIQQNRFGAIKALQQRFGSAVVLKGAGTLVADDSDTVALCCAGNPGMAVGGMGDLLSGVIGALLAQGLSISVATRLGVWLHAHAADLAVANQGERGLLATDLLPYIRRLINRMGS